jgi:undecaprenyl-diphosphatase
MWRAALARRWKRTSRARLLTSIATGSAVTFLVLAFVLRRAAGSQLDHAVTGWIQAADLPGLHAIMVAISLPGFWPYSGFALAAATVGFWLIGFRREALFVLATTGAGYISATTKVLVERPRPVGESIRVFSELLDYSYPSGHVVGYVSFYGFLFFLVYVLFQRSIWRTAGLWLLGLLVGTIGISRISLGHHWASDVAGGYALGTAYLLILILLYRLTSPELEPVNT